MNDYINIVLALVLIFEAIMSITKKNAIKGAKAEKYTPDSIEKYSVLMGVAVLISAAVLLIAGFSNLGVINIGIDFNKRNAAFFIFYGIVLAIIVVFEIIGHFVILKKRPTGYSGKKSKKKDEDEDF